MRSRTIKKTVGSAPIVRVRFMATGLAVVVFCITGPLLLVWKQAYIASASMRIEKMADTLSALNKEIVTLRFMRDRLSSNERIEKAARTLLRLEYPSSDRIVLVQVECPPVKRGLAAQVAELFAVVPPRFAKGGRE
jgi:cell division protein FtsL